jgi:predicted nucleotidyltransferase
MLHPDFKDLLAVLADERVEYLVIGGYAVGFHAKPRFTKDIDLWVRDSEENMQRLGVALKKFGVPETVLESITTGSPDEIAWFGIPPTRVDILRRVDGGTFSPAYERRVHASWDGVAVPIVALEDLVALKRAAGREQDLRDVRALERGKPQ